MPVRKLIPFIALLAGCGSIPTISELPATYTFKEHGKKVTEHGLWTFAMEKSGSDWKIAGWAWARR